MNDITTIRKPDFVGFFKNYFSSVALMYASLQFYVAFSAYHKNLYGASWQIQTATYKTAYLITTPKVLWWLFLTYSLVKLYQVATSDEKESKCSLMISGIVSLSSSVKITHSERQALLVFALKFFFVPFIVNVAVGHFADLNYKIVDLFRYRAMDIFDRPFFYADVNLLYFKILFALIYTVDVLPFLLGYLIESDRADNKIRSVEFTAMGWFFCLICYPPFNTAIASFLPSVVPKAVDVFPDLPNFHYVLTGCAALLLAGYASASVSLGLKASNLTSRGVVSSGLYAYIRHPAYICKNSAWWLFALAWAWHQAQVDKPYMFNLVCLAVWSWIYYMRAVTEENHLIATDQDYLDYCERVPYRFIPKII